MELGRVTANPLSSQLTYFKRVKQVYFARQKE
jgi:hypothetical protein